MVKMGVFLAYKNYEIISVATGKVHVFKFHQRCLRANGRANFEYPTICNTDIKIFFQVSIAWAPLATSFECSNFLRILDRASNLSILTLNFSSSWLIPTPKNVFTRDGKTQVRASQRGPYVHLKCYLYCVYVCADCFHCNSSQRRIV